MSLKTLTLFCFVLVIISCKHSRKTSTKDLDEFNIYVENYSSTSEPVNSHYSDVRSKDTSLYFFQIENDFAPW